MFTTGNWFKTVTVMEVYIPIDDGFELYFSQAIILHTTYINMAYRKSKYSELSTLTFISIKMLYSVDMFRYAPLLYDHDRCLNCNFTCCMLSLI